MPSLVAADIHNEPLNLVYIDGNHSYDGVKADIWAWEKHLKPGGVMAFDDYDNEMHEVTPAVNQLMSLMVIHGTSLDKSNTWLHSRNERKK